MAGPGADAHAVVGDAESFDRAAHIVAIVENDLAPMAIVALETGLAPVPIKLRETHVPVQIDPKLVTPARVPSSRPKARPTKYSPLLPTQARSGEQLSWLSGISTQFSSGTGAEADANVRTQGQQHWQV